MTSIQRMIEQADAKAKSGKVSKKAAGLPAAVAGSVEVLKKVQALGESAARIETGRRAVKAMPAATIKFLMKIDQGLSDRLEAERRRRGLRSRVETIRQVLNEAVPK